MEKYVKIYEYECLDNNNELFKYLSLHNDERTGKLINEYIGKTTKNNISYIDENKINVGDVVYVNGGINGNNYIILEQ